MDRISKFSVPRTYEKRTLLIIVNLVAGLSIPFFGYVSSPCLPALSISITNTVIQDRGVMGGVNTNRSHAVTIGFSHYNDTLGFFANKPFV